MVWEEKVNSKQNETKNLTKTDLLSKYIPNITNMPTNCFLSCKEQ